ncbi:MAG: lytic transglycosylase domain-containing protein, partial [Deltaproteobacteria bacterium]
IYGAIGICQFMPSNVFIYGVDVDGDGAVNLFDKQEAFHSVANYISKTGWKKNLSRKEQATVIYQYNHSNTYVETVLTVMEKLKSCTSNR